MKDQQILTVANLSVTVGDETIVENVSFEVAAKEHLTIIGPNGSGKTTLFKALIGVIPYSGSVLWADGVKIGYVPQKLDIERNVPLSLQDFLETKGRARTKKELGAYLSLVHLSTDLLRKPLGALSGGEFQRSLVAFALIGDTNVLLFDEPTAGIDKPSEEQMYETLHRLQEEKGVTIVTISHDLSLVNRYAQKVLCLNKQGICYGVPGEVLRPEMLAKLYGTERYKFYHHEHGTR